MKIRYAMAALAVAAISLPSIASAETVVIKKIHRDGPRAEMRMHRDYGMRGRHHGGDRVVVIKRSHHRY
jgi:hypothetical protein